MKLRPASSRKIGLAVIDSFGDVGAGAGTTGKARHSSRAAAASPGQEDGDRDAVARLFGSRRHTQEELEFLETAAQKLGIAVENLRLLEQVLRSQRQWMNTFDSIQDLILAHDADFRILKTNQALLQRLEQAPADVLGHLCEEVLPQKRAWSGCPYCERGSGLTEGMDPCFGGQSMVSTSSYAEQGGQQKGTIHVVHDTTARQVAEEKYRMLFEQAQEGVFVATPDGELLDCNDAFVTMLGYGSRDELMALDMGSVLHGVAEEREAFRKEIEAHNYVRNFEITVRRKDGTLLAVAQSCFATRDSGGQIERYQGFVLDITEKKRSEDEMRRRNRELNALNAMAVIATQSFDLDEILNLTLRQVISLFGAETGSVYLAAEPEGTYRRRAGWGPRSEARVRMAEVVFPEGLGDLVMRSRAEVVTQDFLPHLPAAVVEFICADRLPYWIWVVLWSKDKPIGIMGIASKEDRHYSSNDENLLVAISRQLATTIEKVQLYEETCRAYEDLRRTQEQLLQSEKMSAVGQLISGVAHELNNPLTAILGYAQLLEGAGLDPRSADYVRKLFKQAQRTHRVVQNLLSFARQRKPQKQEVDLRKVLEESLTLREYDLKVNNVSLEREIPDGLTLGRSRSASTGAGLPERDQQRARCDGGGQRQRCVESARLQERRVRVRGVRRQRSGNQGSKPDFRSLLHHQVGGQGNWSWVEHLLRDRQGTWRRNRGAQPRRGRSDDCSPFAGQRETRVSGDGGARRGESRCWQAACCWSKTKKRCWNLNATCWSVREPKSQPP